MTVRIHPTANIEHDVELGPGTAVWQNVHIRHGTRIGVECIVGDHSTIAYEVHIGNRVKINSQVSICHGVTIADGVLISAGTVFTNDDSPRATDPSLTRLRSSAPDENTLATYVGEGATLGANCTIGPGITIGRFAMIGMGSVVTRSVADFILAYGNPARPEAVVCRCGEIVSRLDDILTDRPHRLSCPDCERRYLVDESGVEELDDPNSRGDDA